MLFLLDATKSFREDIATFRAHSVAIIQELRAAYSDVRVRPARSSDTLCCGVGREPPSYALELPLTADTTRFEPVLAQIHVQGAGDLPEAQLEALVQTMTGEGRRLAGGCAALRSFASSFS